MENHTVNKTWKFIVLAALAIAVTVSLGFYMYQGSINNITLQLENEVIEIASTARTLEELLEKESIPFNKDAYINMDLDTELKDNMNIIIKNPKSYTISFAGGEYEVKSFYRTVSEVLDEQGIVLGDKDFTSPKLDATVSDGGNIELFKVEEVVETVEDIIPFNKMVNKNNKMDIGTSKVVQNGKDGLKKSHFKKEFINGKLHSIELVKEEIVTEPISEVVEKGTKDLIVTSRGNTSYRKAITMTATAYDASFESTGKNPGDKYYGLTALGTKARPGVVAVDPRVIPLGTKLYVQSLDGSKDYGFAIAEDTGGAIKGNKIDLFFETSSEVNRFGRRKVKVYVLK
ncbi:G5 domain-containing protein [Tissierella carlieri]|uniref:3D domain-containing protein n=1 Tax=Tissierella carlieri TaxID=689904 RepID=UPI001C1186C8|nr:3D domain-containing protein [Tissierella carlieri]MBU5313195.1 G5 domain-containing protein [Tissierella carlieri]MDU5081336.1 3D domain-containing protein [Bacillota bacterium]